MRYYKLWSFIDEDDAELVGGPELRTPFTNWLTGSQWREPVPDPIVVRVENSGHLLPFYDDPVPAIKADLLRRMHSAGVSNLDDYPLLVRGPSTGDECSDYRAVNVIGVIAAVDPTRSEGAPLGENESLGKFYDRIVIDEAKTLGALCFRLQEDLSCWVVAEPVKQAMMEHDDVRGIEFTPLFEVSSEDDEDGYDPDLDETL